MNRGLESTGGAPTTRGSDQRWASAEAESSTSPPGAHASTRSVDIHTPLRAKNRCRCGWPRSLTCRESVRTRLAYGDAKGAKSVRWGVGNLVIENGNSMMDDSKTPQHEV